MADNDIWRNSYLRYLGYANEVGESFRPIAPRAVLPSYAVSFGYVIGDTIDKATAVKQDPDTPLSVHRTRVFYAAADTLLWQSLASVIVPGFTINRVVAMSSAITKKFAAENPLLRRWAPTAIGLAIIPAIIHPIDHGVDWTLDRTSRPFFRHLLFGKDNK